MPSPSQIPSSFVSDAYKCTILGLKLSLHNLPHLLTNKQQTKKWLPEIINVVSSKYLDFCYFLKKSKHLDLLSIHSCNRNYEGFNGMLDGAAFL